MGERVPLLETKREQLSRMIDDIIENPKSHYKLSELVDCSEGTIPYLQLKQIVDLAKELDITERKLFFAKKLKEELQAKDN